MLWHVGVRSQSCFVDFVFCGRSDSGGPQHTGMELRSTSTQKGQLGDSETFLVPLWDGT
jgi:hypothetical protein